MKIKKAIVTSGPTKEWIDPVRYITNASSGKMGFSIANALKSWIEDIVYVHGEICSGYSNVTGAKSVFSDTTLDMKNNVLKELQDNTIVIMAAAPADFRPRDVFEKKIKKEEDNTQSISLVKNPDILIEISREITARNLQNVITIGFAAETNDIEKHALDKLKRKNLNLIIANQVYKNSQGFGNIDSSVSIYNAEKLLREIKGDKETIGQEISVFLKTYFNQ